MHRARRRSRASTPAISPPGRRSGGYDAIEQGFSSGDYTKLARGRQAMEAWRREIEAVAGELRELLEHFGIEGSDALESRSRAGVLQRSTQRTKSSARPVATA